MSLVDLIEKPIAFNRAFVDLGIGITGALMLSQCVYWMKRTRGEGGWFYKSQAEWERETGMTRREQETARKKLVAAGFLEEHRKGVPARLHYRVDFDALEEALQGVSSRMAESANQECRKRATSMAESDRQECTEAPASDGGKRQTITETTAENTTEREPSDPDGRTTDPPPDLTPPTEDQVLELARQSQPSEETACLKDGKRWGTLEDVRLALWIGQMVDSFLEQDAPARRNIATWANDIRLMRHQDRREIRHIKLLFEWAHGHDFWASNILSPGKLREQWAQLAAQRKREREVPHAARKPGSGSGGIDYNRADW